MNLEGYNDIAWVKSRKNRIKPLERDFVIRQSHVQSMMLCQGRVALPVDLGWPALPPNEAMFFGTVVHAAIEEFIADIDIHDDDPWGWIGNPDFYLQVADECAKTEGVALGTIVAYPAQRQWSHEIMFAVNKWVEQVWLPWLVEFRILGQEREMFMPLGTFTPNADDEYPHAKKKVWLKGTPDLWVRDLLIDWKTAGSGWRPGKADGLIQDFLYAALIEYNTGEKLRAARFAVYDRAARRWDAHDTSFTDEQIEAAKQQAYIQARALYRLEYSFNPYNGYGKRGWQCDYCDVASECDAQRLV